MDLLITMRIELDIDYIDNIDFSGVFFFSMTLS